MPEKDLVAWNRALLRVERANAAATGCDHLDVRVEPDIQNEAFDVYCNSCGATAVHERNCTFMADTSDECSGQPEWYLSHAWHCPKSGDIYAPCEREVVGACSDYA